MKNVVRRMDGKGGIFGATESYFFPVYSEK